MKRLFLSFFAVTVLSGCQLFAIAGSVSETSTGGQEMLEFLSEEPIFYDTATGEVLIDAAVRATGGTADTALPGADPLPGSVEMLGKSGDIRAARWQETMNGVTMDCSGWFDADDMAAWGCGEGDPGAHPPIVEYQITCRDNGSHEMSLFSLDDRVAALRVDRADGSSLVGIDPDGRGLVAISTGTGTAQVLAQTDDGQVFEVRSVAGVALCPPQR